MFISFFISPLISNITDGVLIFKNIIRISQGISCGLRPIFNFQHIKLQGYLLGERRNQFMYMSNGFNDKYLPYSHTNPSVNPSRDCKSRVNNNMTCKILKRSDFTTNKDSYLCSCEILQNFCQFSKFKIQNT